MVKWLGKASFQKVSLPGVEDGADVCKCVYLELKMEDKAGIDLGDVVLWRIFVPDEDKDTAPTGHAMTLAELDRTDGKYKYKRVDEGKLKEDVNGSWLLVTPPFVPLSGEGVGGVVQRGEGMVAT